MKIIQLVVDVNMGLGHPGLIALCKENFKLDVTKLRDGELLMFLNRDRSKLKILGKQGLVLGYLRMPNGRKIMLEAIQYLPATFGGAGFNYDSALERALNERLISTQGASKRRVSALEAYRAKVGAGLTTARMAKTQTAAKAA